MRRLGTKRAAAALAIAATFGGVAVPHAAAVEVLGFRADIVVDTSSWAACGVVRDNLTGAPNYTAVLTATGFESSVAANGVILDVATASGNPANPCTSGGFNSTYAVVQYTLEWTSVLGTTGSLVKTCFEVLGIPVCTVS